MYSKNETKPTDDRWREIDASASREQFLEYEKYLKDSYKWKPEDRILYLKEAFKGSQKFENDSLVYFYVEKLGALYRDLDSLSLSLAYLNIAIEHSHTPLSKRITYNTLGSLHFKFRDNETALEYYFKSVEEAKKLKNGSEAYPLGNISEIYAILEDYESAIKYLKHSIKCSQNLVSPEKEYSLTYDYSYILNYYYNFNKLDSANHYLDLVLDNVQYLETIQQQKYLDAQFVGYFAIAEYYLDIEKPKLAKNYIEKTKSKAQPFYLTSVLILEAKYEVLTKDYQEALKILNEEAILKEFDSKDEVNKLKTEVYQALGNYKKVIELKDIAIENQKLKFGNNIQKYSAFADAKYENFQKSEEIKSLILDQKVKKLTIQNQRYIVILVFALFLMFAIAAFLLWRQFLNRKKLSIYLQEQVDQKTTHLQKANEELTILSFVASHDLKEPIRTISNFAGLIKRKLPDGMAQEFDFYFNSIDKSTAQIYNLVEDIASFVSMSKDSEINKVMVNMDEQVNSLFLGMDSLIKEKNGKVINLGIPTIKTNATIMHVILTNLIENGLKFNQSTVPTIKVSYQSNETTHQIIVEDNGIGIEEKYHQQIFIGFKRLNNRYQYSGSGIGLAIAKLLSTKIGGTILVESQLNKGSKFIVNLPKES